MTESCAIPGCGSDAKFALPLKREKKSGLWTVTAVCSACQKSLAREAKAAGKAIRFYGLESAEREAKKRNAQTLSFRPFLDRFATAKAKGEPKGKPELKLAANH